MRTFIANLFILTAAIGDKTITGTGIDGDIKIDFAVTNNDVNQRLFVPESNLVVSGKARLGKELATMNVWISKVIAVVSLPEPAPAPVEAEIVEVDAITESTAEVVPQTPAQKRAATKAAKRARVESEEPVHF
jgi:hypothetical protein